MTTSNGTQMSGNTASRSEYRRSALTGTLIVWLIALLVVEGRGLLRPISVNEQEGLKVDNWENLIKERSPVLGVPSAEFKIIEFSDFQCPFCKIADPILAQFVANHPNHSVLYRYDLPLQQIHRYAFTASVAAHCAEQQGIWEPYQSLLFQHQEEFSSLDWTALAKESGVADAETFTRCINSAETRERVNQDIKVAGSLGIVGTPSFIINGMLYKQSVTEEKLESLYREMEAKRYNLLHRLFHM
jgi:predicted DsbA family dithiol-disulfide isomerase